MAGGSLTITVPTYAALQSVAQRVSCWAGGTTASGTANNRQIQILSNTPAIVIPEALFSIGALALEPGGTDLLSGYVPGTNITFNANNGTVDITWGDGTSTLGAAESGAAAHTFPYRPATFTVRVADASAPATFVETQVYVP